VAPVKGVTPSSTATTTDENYTITSLDWLNYDGTEATLINNKFKPSTKYKAKIICLADDGYRWTGTTTAIIANSSEVSININDDINKKDAILLIIASYDATEDEIPIIVPAEKLDVNISPGNAVGAIKVEVTNIIGSTNSLKYTITDNEITDVNEGDILENGLNFVNNQDININENQYINIFEIFNENNQDKIIKYCSSQVNASDIKKQEFLINWAITDTNCSIKAKVNNEEIQGNSANLEIGTQVTFIATLNEGYKIKNWIVNGQNYYYNNNLKSAQENIQVLENSIIITITENINIDLVTELIINQYNLSLIQPENGIISVKNSLNEIIKPPCLIDEGTNLIFTLVPNENYELSNWIVNDKEVQAEDDKTLKLSISLDTIVTANIQEIVLKTVSIGNQSNELVQGTGANATFEIITNNIDNGITPTVIWIDTQPNNLTYNITNINNNSSTLTIETTNTTNYGETRFKISADGIESNEVILKIKQLIIKKVNLNIIQPTNGGTINGTQGEVEVGSIQNYNINLLEGYNINAWNITSNGTNIDNNYINLSDDKKSLSLIVPDVPNDINITALLKEVVTLQVVQPDNGTISIINPDNIDVNQISIIDKNTEVTFKVALNDINKDYTIEWLVNGSKIEGENLDTFILEISENSIITSNLNIIEKYTISWLVGQNGSLEVFNSNGEKVISNSKFIKNEELLFVAAPNENYNVIWPSSLVVLPEDKNQATLVVTQDLDLGEISFEQQSISNITLEDGSLGELDAVNNKITGLDTKKYYSIRQTSNNTSKYLKLNGTYSEEYDFIGPVSEVSLPSDIQASYYVQEDTLSLKNFKLASEAYSNIELSWTKPSSNPLTNYQPYIVQNGIETELTETNFSDDLPIKLESSLYSGSRKMVIKNIDKLVFNQEVLIRLKLIGCDDLQNCKKVYDYDYKKATSYIYYSTTEPIQGESPMSGLSAVHSLQPELYEIDPDSVVYKKVSDNSIVNTDDVFLANTDYYIEGNIIATENCNFRIGGNSTSPYNSTGFSTYITSTAATDLKTTTFKQKFCKTGDLGGITDLMAEQSKTISTDYILTWTIPNKENAKSIQLKDDYYNENYKKLRNTLSLDSDTVTVYVNTGGSVSLRLIVTYNDESTKKSNIVSFTHIPELKN